MTHYPRLAMLKVITFACTLLIQLPADGAPSHESSLVKIGHLKDGSSGWRDYYAEITPIEKEFIAFIVSTLGNKSLTKIWKEKSSLKKAGDKIDHIHPLKFLSVIFSDEQLKVAIANLKESRWVWNEFKSGLYSTLTEELANENISEEHILDFADQLDIDVALITPSITQADWDEFFSVLIKNVPREGNPDRYDM